MADFPSSLVSSRNLRRILPWLVIVAAAVVLPVVLPPFRLNLLGRFLSLGIVALGIDLIWGYTGMLSLANCRNSLAYMGSRACRPSGNRSTHRSSPFSPSG